MATYVYQCDGGDLAILNAPGSDYSYCADAGGVASWVEFPVAAASPWPELSLSDGGLIAGAVIALWGLAWSFRVIKKQLESE